jgi:5-methyltetrahydrofolate--homocysteine methyltransferase
VADIVTAEEEQAYFQKSTGILREIAENLIQGKAPQTKELVEKAMAEGIPVGDILQGGLIAGMAVIGTRFKHNKVYVPEVLIAARAMKAGMEIIKPALAESDVKPVGTMVLGTVKGDLHDIGKNLVSMMMEGAGFKVIDLGINVEPQKFVEAVRDNGANLLGMSALLTTTMIGMKTTIDAVREAGLYDDVKIMVGGAPLTDSYAEEIGAHGYAPDAASSVDKAKELLGVA